MPEIASPNSNTTRDGTTSRCETCSEMVPALIVRFVLGHAPHKIARPEQCPLWPTLRTHVGHLPMSENGMDRPRSRPQRLSECLGGLSGEGGAPPCLAHPPFTQ